MKLFYTIGVNLYTFGVHVASIWSSKAKKWVNGRKNVWNEISTFEAGDHVYWFHCASLGEFEQGRPLMEEIKAKEHCQIVVTFFSPSGYEVKKDYNGADLVVYLPKDSKKNASRFLGLINPTHVVFIKYEFWANYILECKNREIPIYSVAALFRKDQVFFTAYGGFMRKILKSFSRIFVQNTASQELLASIDIESEICGDPRYDRVMRNAASVESYDDIENFCKGKKVLICGSIWADDLRVIQNQLSILKDWKVIVAPHEISEQFVSKIETGIRLSSIRYSEMSNYDMQDLLIIDNVGMLMNVYQYGDMAFVGGGFKTGLHNILEPAAFGLPVIFGDQFEKFPEAFEFIEGGIGFSVENEDSFVRVFSELSTTDFTQKVKEFMESRRGATEAILKDLST